MSRAILFAIALVGAALCFSATQTIMDAAVRPMAVVLGGRR